MATSEPVETTLGEQLLLLSLDDRSGAEQEAAKAAWAISAASLVELALAGRIGVDGDRVTVLDPAPLGVPVLDAALGDIAARDRPRKTGDWVRQWRKEAVAGASRGLLAKGLVEERTKKVLGLFPVRRYPEADGSVEYALRRRLEGVVLRGETPDDRTASLVALLHGAKLHKLALPGFEVSAVEGTMAVIAAGHWSAETVRRVVKAAEAAMAAAIAMTVTSAALSGG